MNNGEQFFNTSGGGYAIERSLRFNSSDSAYLSRTPASAGNRRTFTWAGWVKRSQLGTNQRFFGNLNSGGTSGLDIEFTAADEFRLVDYTTSTYQIVTSALYRDVSAWYHIVVAVDTTQATDTNRIKLYVNGVQVTAFSTSTYYAQNTDSALNTTTQHAIGRPGEYAGLYLNGYLADVHFIDGQALDPTSFGEFDDNGIWQPIAYSGTYTTGTIYSTGWVQSISNPDRAFNGNTSDFASGSTGTAIQYNFPSTISSTASVRVRNWGMSGTYRLNYGLADQVNQSMSGGNQFDTLTTLPSSGLKNILFEVSPGFGVAVAGIEVDGSLLVDGSGINSFHLPFSDNSTAAALGTDTSGNGNDWTVNNIQATVQTGRLYAQASGTSTSAFSSATLLGNFPATVGGSYAIYDADLVTPVTSATFSYLYSFSSVVEVLVSADGTNWTSKGNQSSSYTTVSHTSAFRYVRWFYSTFNFGITNNPAQNDSLVDVPTNGTETDTGIGGQVRGNYATLNPLDKSSSINLSNGNLTNVGTVTNVMCRSTIFVSSGKWYYEATLATYSGNPIFGWASSSANLASWLGNSTSSWGYAANAMKYSNGSGSSYGASFGAGDVIGIAADLDAGTLVFYKNGVSQGTAYSNLSGELCPAFSSGASTTVDFNFGQRPFAYTAPSGFKALNTASLPAPVVTKPSEYMDIALWTGQGNTNDRTITTSFNPDFVWIKSRSNGTYNHALFDANRGFGTNNVLSSNTTGAEGATDQGYIKSTTDSSMTLGVSGGGNAYYNGNNFTYASWYWDAGSSTVTNTDGSITSSVRANPSAGFSIVTASPSGTADTYGHGLGVTPSLIISKRTDGTGAWYVRTSFLANPGSHYLILNSTAAVATDSSAWANTAANSSVITFNASYLYGGSVDLVSYCFAPVAGYSSFGSYTGTGFSDNRAPFLYLGFKPKWVMIKSTTLSHNWTVFDSVRGAYNVTDQILWPNKSNAEAAVDSADTNTGDLDFDILSNGIKFRTANWSVNKGSSDTYIYAAFAESPFQYARAR